MQKLLLTILNMSFAASWLVMAVVVLRLVLKKAPRWIHVLLWAMVGLRLICPVTLESALSLIPSAQVVSPQILAEDVPGIHTGIEPVDQVINPVFVQAVTPAPGDSADPLQVWLPVAVAVWLAGIAIMGLYTLLSYRRLHRRVAEAVRLEDRVYRSERINSPFVLGLFRPRIYLPAELGEAERPYVLAHEQAHIRRRDHWWKPLGFALLAIHWFNPLMWVAYILLCRDIELACDEKVVRLLDTCQRADYSQALLSCSVSRASIAACPLAFGEVGVKERVKSVLSYKKPGFWILLAAILVCVAVAVCFLTNPADPGEETYSERVLAIGVQTSDGSVLQDEETWYYFAVHEGETVTVPGDTPLKVTVKGVNGKDFAVSLDTALYYEGVQTRELELQAGVWKDLNTGTPGGSIRYSFLNMSRVTEFGAVYPWIPDTTGMGAERTMMLPSFPGVTFHCNKSSVWSEGGPWGQWELFTGMPIENVYVSDISGDGLPEICATVCWGSGMIDTYVMVVDFAAGDLFMLRDRGIYDYFLEVEENTLVCIRRPYNKEEVLEKGVLTLVEAAGGSGRKLIIADNAGKEEQIPPATEKEPTPGVVFVVTETNLTMEAVLELAKKGENLTWKDLQSYNGQDIGSGVCIMRYPIDGVYVLQVYADRPDAPIKAANLGIRDTNLYVDIRTGDVTEFLREYGEIARDIMIRDAILAANKKEYPDGLVNAAAVYILDTERVSGTPLAGNTGHVVKETVYLYGMYGCYAASGDPALINGQLVPAVAVFVIDETGYTLAEYWEPRMGQNAESDIRSRFPAALVEQALNGGAYREELERQCRDQVLNLLYSSGNLPERIDALLQQILSSPLHSSAPGDYIKDHPLAYEELLSYGEFTLRYCFGAFFAGGQTDLRGHIMAIACEDIMASWGEVYDIEPQDRMTGQAWFHTLCALAVGENGQPPKQSGIGLQLLLQMFPLT